MTSVIFLGTAGAAPTKERGLPSVAIERNGKVYLFDCGEGTQRQLMAFSVNISRIAAVFLSHAHGDHVIGIAGLIRTLALNRRTDPLTIYVPKGEEKKIHPLIGFDEAILSYKIEVRGIGSGIVYKGDGIEIRAFALRHSVKALGYIFDEPARLHFDKERCKRLGIKGEMFAQLEKSGHIAVNGKRISIGSITTKGKGRRIVYAADTRPQQNTVTAAKGADILIHEATYSNALVALAKERMHSTAKEAAEIAKKAKVNKLVIFHTSARYRDTAPLLKEARSVFRNADVAHDGMRMTL
ncbi:MAG: ribonuclease Z [Candidatus Micrarchaeota archaeon]|nr:ribonuclease Z [Candidatus Micrarchaeota archaeon]